MNVLIIGSGGREHALGWKIRQSPKVEKLYFAPGNGGTFKIGENVDIGIGETTKLINFVKEKKIDLTVVGPELPLASGIVDEFTKEGLQIFGPTKNASRLETSKAWAVEFMNRHNVPHPKSHIFTNINQAKEFIKNSDWPSFVIKADGLAAGKGVLLTSDKEDAIDTLSVLMVDNRFGEAGKKVLIQEKLDGFEVSIIALADGRNAQILLPAQDHKRAYDGNKGPNTGGMGAYCPVTTISPEVMMKIKAEILEPVMRGMEKEGYPYKGAIYPGLMITQDGPKVLEFNARFGDPETQSQMLLLKSDLVELMVSCASGSLPPDSIVFEDGVSLCVVIASKGYPETYKTGKPISGLDAVGDPEIQVFHAGTKKVNDQTLTDGGRVLCLATKAPDISMARKKLYDLLDAGQIAFEGMEFRRDIGATLQVNQGQNDS